MSILWQKDANIYNYIKLMYQSYKLLYVGKSDSSEDFNIPTAAPIALIMLA
jgi:hypothetical protein